MSKKKTIYFHGYLKDLVGDKVEVEANSVAEAVRSLEFLPGYAPESGLRSVTIDEVDSQVALYGTDVVDEINIRPLASGAGGDNGLLQVVIGVTLIAVGFVIGPQASLFGLGIIEGSSLIMAGAMMALGGVLQMLAPSPEIEQEEDESKYLGANQNTVKIGTRIPLLYGASRIPGHYLHFNTDAKELRQQNDLSIAGVTDTGETAQNLVEGTGPYAEGRFAYSIQRKDWAYNAGGSPENETVVRTYRTRVLGSGRVDTIDPDDILREVLGDQNVRSHQVVYKTQFQVPANDDYEFRLAQENSGEHLEIYDEDAKEDVTPVGSVYTLTAGTLYRITITITRSEYLLGPLENPEGELQFKQGAGAWTTFADDSLTGGLVNDLPVDAREIIEGVYYVYDEPTLADDLTPVQPVFSSQTRGPSNIPTSGWSI